MDVEQAVKAVGAVVAVLATWKSIDRGVSRRRAIDEIKLWVDIERSMQPNWAGHDTIRKVVEESIKKYGERETPLIQMPDGPLEFFVRLFLGVLGLGILLGSNVFFYTHDGWYWIFLFLPGTYFGLRIFLRGLFGFNG